MRLFKVSYMLEHTEECKYKGYNSTSTIEIDLDKAYSFKYLFNDEVYEITITNLKDNKILVDIDDIYGKEDYEVVYSVEPIIKYICVSMSYICQYNNVNSHLYDIKYTYSIDRCKVIEKNPSNELRFRYGISSEMKTNWKINLDKFGFQKVLIKTAEDKVFKNVMELYYKSLGNIETTSRYYNLFVIIEFIENNYTSQISYTNVLSEPNKVDFLKKTKANLIEILQEDDTKINLLYGAIAQICNKATIESRKVKLYKIITEYFNIRYLSICDKKIEITEEMIKTFIDKRNSLFHAGNIKNDELSKFEDITNKLMILCGEIIGKLLEE